MSQSKLLDTTGCARCNRDFKPRKPEHELCAECFSKQRRDGGRKARDYGGLQVRKWHRDRRKLGYAPRRLKALRDAVKRSDVTEAMPAEYWARQIGYERGRDVKCELQWLADNEGWMIADDSNPRLRKWAKNVERHNYRLEVGNYPEPNMRWRVSKEEVVM